MHEGEQQSRREAVRRVLAGEPVAAVAAEPWAQVGASAIAWELTKLGIDDPPPPRTIERILARHDEPRRARRGRYTPKGTDYPAPPMLEPNACQQGDTVGPRHLEGGELFYVFNVVDVGRRKAAGQICVSKSAEATCTALMAIWDRLGLPQRLQLDNQQALAGAGRRPGLVARACLANGVTPTYIPPDFTGLTGQVEWIRLIRSDKQLRVLDHRITMPDELTYEYVTATLIVEDQELAVTHQDREISRHPYPLR